MNKQIKVSTAIVLGLALIAGNIIYNEFIRKETLIPEPETKIQLVEEKYPVSVIEEKEKCKDWGGEFSADTSERTFGKYLDMKCEKETGVMNGLYKTETLFNYSIGISYRNQ